MIDQNLEYLQTAGISAENIAAFAERLKAGTPICPTSFAEFNACQDVSETVRLLGLDAEKFWNLVLFSYDYATDMRSHGLDEVAGGNEMMWGLIDRGRQIINNEKVEPLKTDATCTFKLQGRSYKIKNADSIAVLLYWIHLGMMNSKPTDPIWELNWLIDDYDCHTTQRMESQSVAIWCFAATIRKFFKAATGIRARARGNSDVSLNKLLLISRLVYLTKMSDNDNFMYSDDTIKGFLRQYKDYALPTRGRYYQGMRL